MKFIYLLESWKETKKVAINPEDPGNKEALDLFVNHGNSSTKKEEEEMFKRTGAGLHSGLRIFLVPFRVDEKGQKIVDPMKFDDVDVYFWDARLIHELAIKTFDAFKQYKTPDGKSIETPDVFKGDRPPFGEEFEFGPYFKSFSSTSNKTRENAEKAMAIATQKTYYKFHII